MKNLFVLGVAALALAGCGKKEEAPVAPAATEAAAPAAANDRVEAAATEAPAAK